jgi:streptogramin lyase
MESRAIVRVDVETYEIETMVSDLPVLNHPISGVVANGSYWLVSRDKTVTQYDEQTGAFIREIEVGLFPVEPVVAYGDVWTLNHLGNSVTRIDVDTGQPTTIDLPDSGALTLTVVADNLMLVNGGESGPTPTWMVDPQQMKMLGTFETSGCFKQYGEIGTAIDGQVWRRYCGTDEVTIADPRTGEILETFHSPACPYPPLYVDGAMWMPTGPEPCSDTSRGLVALDPETREVLGTYELPSDVRAGGWWFTAFDAWWYDYVDGLVRVPADTLRAALTD